MRSTKDGFYHTLASQCVVGVGKDSVHDAWVSVISFHSMKCRIPFRISIFFIGMLMRNVMFHMHLGREQPL